MKERNLLFHFNENNLLLVGNATVDKSVDTAEGSNLQTIHQHEHAAVKTEQKNSNLFNQEHAPSGGIHLSDDKDLLNYAERINHMDSKKIFNQMLETKDCKSGDTVCMTGSKRVCESDGNPRKCRSINELAPPMAPPMSNLTKKPSSGEEGSNVTSNINAINVTSSTSPVETLTINNGNTQQTPLTSLEDIVKDHEGHAYHNVGFLQSAEPQKPDQQPSFNETQTNLHPDEIATPLPANAEKFISKGDVYMAAYKTSESDKSRLNANTDLKMHFNKSSPESGDDQSGEGKVH